MVRLALALSVSLLMASVAAAQPQLVVSPSEVASGGSVTATITAPPGHYWALVDSTRDAGLVYGGVALGIGTDVRILATGVVGPSGTASVPYAPPIASGGIDVVYLLAVISLSPDYNPPIPSATVAVRERGFYTNTPTFPQGLSVAGGSTVRGLPMPSAPGDAAPKAYVDAVGAAVGAGTTALAPAATQAAITAGSLISIEQRGSGDLMNLRTNSVDFPGGNGLYNPNRTQFRFMPDGGFLARGDITFGTIPMSGVGNRLMWYPAKVAFRAGYADSGGQFDDANIGYYSWAGGALSSAPGNYAFAMGNQNRAEAQCAVAMGSGNNVYGNTTDGFGTCGIAMGLNNDVHDQAGVALGQNSMSDGDVAIAIGYTAVANADYSMAFGYRASTNLHTGARVFSDASTTNPFEAVANNEFAVRAAGGYRLRTNSTLTNGCNLAAGGASWNCASDRNLKEGFESVDGEDVLAKLAAMPVQRWSYKTEPGVLHMGPMAQDFRAAFGLGVDDVTIGHLDEAGVSLRAIQALEARTRDQRDALARQAAEIETLKQLVETLQRQLTTRDEEPRK